MSRLIEVPMRAGSAFFTSQSSDFVLWSDDVFRSRVLSSSDIDQQASRSDKHIHENARSICAHQHFQIIKEGSRFQESETLPRLAVPKLESIP